MMLFEAIAYERVETGTDELGNPVSELAEREGRILVRCAPWRPSHDSTKGNEFDMAERTFLTMADPASLEGLAALRFRGVLYEVAGMTHEASPVAIKARRFKDGADPQGR